ncbi:MULTISPECIES: helix-turn-helix domain-containing protein [unclassified Aminobacter]|uniref:HTH domain-containing protein n=1 Tax=unclassified Aminobacter TaxID=2644704 RepID=UPI000464EBD8|nr:MULTISPECIES: helix-turn-helix domain-containing protein [unclassified Aminobacter]TWH33943.1 putative transcriptional regulator [Aminobacter sp. J15]
MCKFCDKREQRRKALLNALKPNTVVTSDQLAGVLGVTPRSVYRQIRALRQSGIRVDGQAGVGYMLRRERARA